MHRRQLVCNGSVVELDFEMNSPLARTVVVANGIALFVAFKRLWTSEQ